METSDLSDKPFNADTKAHVFVRLEDGRESILRVTAFEAEELYSRGIERRGPRALLRGFGRLAPRFLKWAALLTVTALAIPALTKQWADGQAELALKRELMTDISQEMSKAFNAAQAVAREQTGAKQPRLRTAALDQWVLAEGEIDPVFRVMFRDADVADLWLGYRNIVFDYVAMSCCDAKYSEDLAIIRRFVTDYPIRNSRAPPVEGKDPWNILACVPETCRKSKEYAETYRWLGLVVLQRRGVLLQSLTRADAKGLSRGFEDFVRDVTFSN